MAFWGPSAIIRLCCWQPETADSRRLRREFKRMIVWWGTSVETRNALARLMRDGHLTREKRLRAAARFDLLRAAGDRILPTEKVRSLDEDLPDAHGVRAADALQLAAALVWCRELPKQRPFVCFARLSAAAIALGFSVRPWIHERGPVAGGGIGSAGSAQETRDKYQRDAHARAVGGRPYQPRHQQSQHRHSQRCR